MAINQRVKNYLFSADTGIGEVEQKQSAPTSPTNILKKIRQMRVRVKKGHFVLYKTERGKTFRMKVTQVSGNRVFLFHPSFGTILTELVNIHPSNEGSARWVAYEVPIDNSAVVASLLDGKEKDKLMKVESSLKVLRNKDNSNIANKIYRDLISDVDFTYYADFLLEFDQLLFKYRKGKASEDPATEQLEEDEDENMENDEDEELDDENDDEVDENIDDESDDDLSDLVEDDEVDDEDTENDEKEVVSSMSQVLSSYVALSKESIERHPMINSLMSYAVKKGYKQDKALPQSNNDIKSILSMTNNGKYIYLGWFNELNSFVFAFSITSSDSNMIRKGQFTNLKSISEKAEELITNNRPRKVLEAAKDIIDRY